MPPSRAIRRSSRRISEPAMPDPAGAARQLLRIEDLHAWYGESHILHGMGFAVGEIYAIFPNLKERRRSQGTKLSGGEQQMLAIGRMLRTGATLLLLDEPTEGLAPVVVQQIGGVIRRLKQKGFTILLVEQNFHFAATLADRHYVVEHGRVIDMIRNEDLAQNLDKLQQYLGV